MRMNSYSKNQECNLSPGSAIIGKWHKQLYKVIRKLCAGASGTVYLANSAKGLVALKIGVDNMSITSEVNVLKHFSKVQGQILGPSLIDVDDVIIQGKAYPFYAMEYLNGDPFLQYLRDKGSEWLGIFMVQLLGDLDRLHKAGWVFGDLKPDNLLVVGPPAKVRWLDVGGTTLLGRSIKEYTEFFDRGYWELGSRKAEPSYDLFAVAMIMVNCGYPRRFEKQGREPVQLLRKKIEEKDLLHPYSHIILRALQGKYTNATMMREAMIKVLSHKSPSKQKGRGSREDRKKHIKHQTKKGKQPSYFTEVFLLLSFLILLSILYLFGQMM